MEKMKLKIPNKYTIATILLIAAAVCFLAIALISPLGEFVSAAFVISSMGCAITGVFLFTFSGGEPVDQRLVGILPAQCSINLCSISHYIGVQGNAFFLPPRITGETKVLQFNPTSTAEGKKGIENGSFRENGSAGLVTPPSCDFLIQNLRERNALVIPDNEENLILLLRETIEDVFKFAPRLSARWRSSSVTITFHGFPSIDVCKVIAQKSPHCCTMNPCPICSLCGVLIAEGIDEVVTLDRCTTSTTSQDVTAVFSILPLNDIKP
jgi:hypothetical protein